jgi:PAS domain S-box-containing protein
MDGILGCDENESVVIFNKSMEQMLGCSRDRILHNMTLDRIFPQGEKQRLKAAIEGEKFGGKNRLHLYETNLLGMSGHQIPVQASATVLLDEGRETGLVYYFRDLREIRKLEQEVADQARILHQDKMMSLGRLAASVVHEINNPLAGILNYLHLMLQIINRGPLSEERREKFRGYLELVESETGRCSKIISSLLTFSRKSPPSFGEVQIEELINRCVILSQHKLELSNIKLTHSVAPNMPPVQGDFNQLQQCIINLIFNAIDAMPNGGSLELSGAVDTRDKRVAIRVKDTGSGIPEKDLAHIFEPFFTTKQEGYGVGLGLSTLYGIIEHHKGSVEVDSKVGKGTEFRILLPAG